MSESHITTPGVAQNWVRVLDEAPWRARDSHCGLVYRDRLWVLGGWASSYEAPPRDVWSSPDGRCWDLIQPSAPWLHSDLSMSAVFNGRMWMMGGWYNGRLPGHSASNQVWWSEDGISWEQATANATWSPRLAAAAVVFKDRMWVLGGTENYYFGDTRSVRNDVWHSADGCHWELATPRAGWSPRAYHQAIVHDNKIWVLGGGNYVPEYYACNDVWCSQDGVDWQLVTDAAPWGPRLWFSCVAYRNGLWVLGGWSQAQDNFGDVWYSRNGKDWLQLRSDVIWKARHEHSACVFQDSIWVAGGHARPLSNEVWRLELPAV